MHVLQAFADVELPEARHEDRDVVDPCGVDMVADTVGGSKGVVGTGTGGTPVAEGKGNPDVGV